VRLDDEGTKRTIREIYETTGELIDPHTAIGIHAALHARRDPRVPVIAIATAHPAKFPDAVEAATGVRPPLPARLAGLFDRAERLTVLPNDLGAVQGFIRRSVSVQGAA